MQSNEQSLIRIVSKVSVWAAPAPSAYFVARSATKHLGVVRPFDAIIALVIETLGISSVHTTLWLLSWNQESLTAAGNLRKGRTLASRAEIGLSVIANTLYLVATIGLIAVLEVLPDLATFAPVIFPILSIVGATCLALISRQENRERALAESKQATQKTAKSKPKAEPSLVDFGNGRQAIKQARKAVLIALLENNPRLIVKDAAESIGTSDQTIYNYLTELESDGLIEKTEEGIKVK